MHQFRPTLKSMEAQVPQKGVNATCPPLEKRHISYIYILTARKVGYVLLNPSPPTCRPFMLLFSMPSYLRLGRFYVYIVA